MGSKNNHFRCSDGTKVTKAQIDYRVREAKKQKIQDQLDDYGYNFCEEPGCGKNHNCGEPLDCSHEKSVDWCQNNGCSELAWSLDNMKIRCRSHHCKKDGNTLKFNNNE